MGSCKDAVEDGLPNRCCGAGDDQDRKCSIEFNRAGQNPDCVLALILVRWKNGSGLGPEVTGSRFSPLPQRKSFDRVKFSVNSREKVDKLA